jgi:c-di-GMP-related signal transduction protein
MVDFECIRCNINFSKNVIIKDIIKENLCNKKLIINPEKLNTQTEKILNNNQQISHNTTDNNLNNFESKKTNWF